MNTTARLLVSVAAVSTAFTEAFVAHGPLRSVVRAPHPPARSAAAATVGAAGVHRRFAASSRPSLPRMCEAGDKTKVLFVCLGNICRSPSAEAVFKKVTADAGAADKFEIDSCGTGGGSSNWYMEGGYSYHEGDPPDERMAMAAANRGITLSGASRPLRPADLDEFDLIVGMDADNARAISTAAKHWGKLELAEAKTRSMTSYCRSGDNIKKVPDPYYGGPQGFETVLDILNDACQGLLDACRESKA